MKFLMLSPEIEKRISYAHFLKHAFFHISSCVISSSVGLFLS